MTDDERPFLSRWSQRKAQVRSGMLPAEPVPAAPAVAAPAAAEPSAPASTTAPPLAPLPAPAPALPPVTMDDVDALTHASDYSRFVAPGVASGVRNAAMKKLFSDPHFNIMDGLDIYIGDYGQPDPIPPEMLRRMVQSKFLGLFDDEAEDGQTSPTEAPPPAPPAPSGSAQGVPGDGDNQAHDDHADLQLQPHHAARRPGPDESPGADDV